MINLKNKIRAQVWEQLRLKTIDTSLPRGFNRIFVKVYTQVHVNVWDHIRDGINNRL